MIWQTPVDVGPGGQTHINRFKVRPEKTNQIHKWKREDKDRHRENRHRGRIDTDTERR